MKVRYTLFWDAEENNDRFVPRVIITDMSTHLPVLQWRAAYSLDTLFEALVHAHDYGETALLALNMLSSASAAEAP
ncbi:MAG: hypothetical protein E5299_02269 [Burkholderia gladioli]|nr:MAG: hypothetical protein E5299_02269 [Burkholderia gladioli]